MKIGIVCINYHCEEFISQLLESIPNDFYHFLDIFLVENSSEQSSLESLRDEFSQLNINILVPNNNLGYFIKIMNITNMLIIRFEIRLIKEVLEKENSEIVKLTT